MKVKELMRMLRGLEDFELKDCGITTEILDALEAKPRYGMIKWSITPQNQSRHQQPCRRVVICGSEILKLDVNGGWEIVEAVANEDVGSKIDELVITLRKRNTADTEWIIE